MSRLIHVMLILIVVVLLSMCAVPGNAAERPDKNGILLVSFGTSMPEATVAIDSLVNAVKEAFPDTEVRVAYTSNIIRRKLKREQNIEIPTPPEALAKMNDDGFTHVCVQPTHIIPGEEFDDLKGVVDAFASLEGKYGFKHLAIGRPFLSESKDSEVMAGILNRWFEKKAKDTRAVVLMGHGSPHMANAMYSELQLALSRVADYFFIGTVEAPPTFEHVLNALEKTGYKTVILSPFMIVAGDHANNDLADADDPESWLSQLIEQGFEVETELVGLGEYPEIVQLFVERVHDLMGEIN